jgi:hypothetical protein
MQKFESCTLWNVKSRIKIPSVFTIKHSILLTEIHFLEPQLKFIPNFINFAIEI